MKSALCLLLSALIFLSGCASIINGTSQTIALRSEVPGTVFYLNDRQLGTDNAVVSVPKKNLEKLVFVGKKPGCRDVSTGLSTKLDTTALLGFLLDLGIISILIVDWGSTGAVLEAERTNYLLNPECPI